MNAVVADSAEEAQALAQPQLQQMARLRSGLSLGPQLTVEEAEVAEVTPAMQELMDRMSERWVIDAPGPAASRIRALADQFGVDEIMVSPGASAHSGVDRRAAPGRVRTLELLAAELA